MTRLDLTRYKATVAYDGTNFSGFQIQPDERTVQGEIEKALKKINKKKYVKIKSSGRTDAGAHAEGMVFHFDYSSKVPKEGLFKAIDTSLSRDISLLELEPVSKEFHARYHAKAKVYIYRIYNHKLRNPFNRNFAYHYPYKIEANRIKKAVNYLIGTHDFTSFCSTKTDKKNKIRTIYDIQVKYNKNLNEWQFIFYGDGFLYNMIRIIMGTVLLIVDEKKDSSEMLNILKAKNRNSAGKTLGAHGLCLKEVQY